MDSIYLSFMTELAVGSGDVIRPFFGEHSTAVEQKADASPVTEADRAAELWLRRQIERRYPEHGILGEEFGTVRGDAEWVWVLDPVDGTKSFVLGVPLFTTLIGLLHRGQPVLGCIHQPILNQLLLGDTKTTTLNGRPVRVRADRPMSEASMLTCDPMNPGRYKNGSRFDDLANRVGVYRTFGDGYGYLLVASGWADMMVDPIMNPWDLLPLVPVIQGAGGVITDWEGAPIAGASTNSCVAATPGLHAEIIGILNGRNLPG